MLKKLMNARTTRVIAATSLATLFLASCGGSSNDTQAAADVANAANTANVQTLASEVKGTVADNTSNAANAEKNDILLAASTSVTAGPTAPYGQDASKYEMVWSDEFENGYDSNVWNDKIWYGESNATKNYAVEGGAMKIWPQRDASGNFFNRTIDTDGKKYFTYGYYEIEAKLPYGKGVWPAFWLLNHDANDSFRPEIDILEAYPGGGPGSNWGTSDLKPNAFRGTIWPKGINGGPEGGHKTLQGLPDLSAGYHKYAVKWEPNKITFLFDGKEYYSANVSMPNRMYVLLDLWYGSASGKPDNSTPTGKANAFEVNYVRVWKNK